MTLYAAATRAIAPHADVQQVAPTGSMPKGVSISPDGTRLYVTNYGQLDHDNVSIVDAQSLAVLGHIDVPGIVVESVVSPDGRTLYVSNFRRHSVQFIDLGTRTVAREVHVGVNPKVVVLSRDGRRLFAANWTSGDVTEVDTVAGTAVRTLRAGRNPRGMAIARDGRLYVANSTSDEIDIYEGPTMAAHRRIPHVCRVPRHLSLSPDDTRLYVSCLLNGYLAVMDTATMRVIRRVSVASGPKSNDVSPDGRYVATADYNAHSVSIIDTTDWAVRRIFVATADRTSGVVWARTGFRIFVTGWFDDHVYAIGETGTLPPIRPSHRQLEQTARSRERHNAVSGE